MTFEVTIYPSEREESAMSCDPIFAFACKPFSSSSDFHNKCDANNPLKKE